MDVLVAGAREAVRLLATGDAEVWAILRLSLLVSGSGTAIALSLGVPAGAALALTRFPGRQLLVSLVNTGMGLPPVVVGLLVTILLWRSGPLGAWEILYTPAAIVVAQAVIAAPIVTGITLAAVQNVPGAFRLQLVALGASRVQMTWMVLHEARLPMLAAVMAGCLPEYLPWVLTAVEETVLPRLPAHTHPLTGPPTLNVSLIEDGSGINVVPARCTIAIDRRLIPGEDAADALAEIDAALAPLRNVGLNVVVGLAGLLDLGPCPFEELTELHTRGTGGFTGPTPQALGDVLLIGSRKR